MKNINWIKLITSNIFHLHLYLLLLLHNSFKSYFLDAFIKLFFFQKKNHVSKFGEKLFSFLN